MWQINSLCLSRLAHQKRTTGEDTGLYSIAKRCSHCVSAWINMHKCNNTIVNCLGTSYWGSSPCASTSGFSFEVAGVPSTCHTHTNAKIWTEIHTNTQRHTASSRLWNEKDRSFLASTKDMHTVSLALGECFWDGVNRFTHSLGALWKQNRL